MKIIWRVTENQSKMKTSVIKGFGVKNIFIVLSLPPSEYKFLKYRYFLQLEHNRSSVAQTGVLA